MFCQNFLSSKDRKPKQTVCKQTILPFCILIFQGYFSLQHSPEGLCYRPGPLKHYDEMRHLKWWEKVEREQSCFSVQLKCGLDYSVPFVNISYHGIIIQDEMSTYVRVKWQEPGICNLPVLKRRKRVTVFSLVNADVLQNHRITEWLWLERISRDHLVQHPGQAASPRTC